MRKSRLSPISQFPSPVDTSQFGDTMKILSREEAARIRGDDLAALVEQNAVCRVVKSIAIPSDAGRRTVLARTLSTSLLEGSPVWVQITGWGVWPSGENWDLFDGYRRAHNEARSLAESPVHLFEGMDDQPKLFSILNLVLFNLWDAEIVSSNNELSVSISHDEWIDVRTPQPAVRTHVEEVLAALEAQQQVHDGHEEGKSPLPPADRG